MSNMMYTAKDAANFCDLSANIEEVQHLSKKLVSFFEGQPERYISDDGFWMDLNKIALEGLKFGTTNIFIEGYSEFDRTFLIAVLYRNGEVRLRVYWWLGKKSLRTFNLQNIIEDTETSDYMITLEEGQSKFYGDHKLFKAVSEQYSHERERISEQVCKTGSTIEPPLNYERNQEIISR